VCPKVRGVLKTGGNRREELPVRIALYIANGCIQRGLHRAGLADLYRNELMPLILWTTAQAGFAGMAAYRRFIIAARVCFGARARNENVQRHEER
jgi:hypothetical protein